MLLVSTVAAGGVSTITHSDGVESRVMFVRSLSLSLALASHRLLNTSRFETPVATVARWTIH